MNYNLKWKWKNRLYDYTDTCRVLAYVARRIAQTQRSRGQRRHESPSPSSPSSASFSKQTELKKPKPRRRHPASPPSAARLLFLLLPPPPLPLRAAPPSATPRLLPATWERGLPRLSPPPPCSRGWWARCSPASSAATSRASRRSSLRSASGTVGPRSPPLPLYRRFAQS